ncbi:hypothetical protein Kpol_2000p88 [Vanderwaltozyma polyspora DSM 70294]|uniref:Carboxypeptidase Y inhibitor n=1 Tax=Vanderwaltozyma polyspora (strain ATCC 22028 / DSM 70294 / BCRC 21397 / CBS 2163 / NBRC 10782 / NRRL Y-8283 / UCD 57-17) TaxID=436907 RepID=A7TF95_VANPO|nr:uncharacterized protein Kpol_2000p88 [Vanderwaltozyma polyspora DSM 70294]EDO19120.1 hypothetical protein Kpol_2000p88 [Vanderwaltozyma polyspora DSM 70294]
MNQGINVCKTVVEALSKHDIVQDVIKNISFKPSGFLVIEYGTNLPVTMGNLLPVAQTQAKPKIQFISSPNANENNQDGFKPFSADKSNLFTLVMTDPDAPSRVDHKWSEYCHYVSTDIPLNNESGDNDLNFTTSFINEGNTLIPYMGPGPPKGTGQHRYIFMLFKQPNNVNGSSFTPIKDRPNWGYGTPATGVAKWATENNLELIATNFFFAENV